MYCPRWKKIYNEMSHNLKWNMRQNPNKILPYTKPVIASVIYAFSHSLRACIFAWSCGWQAKFVQLHVLAWFNLRLLLTGFSHSLIVIKLNKRVSWQNGVFCSFRLDWFGLASRVTKECSKNAIIEICSVAVDENGELYVYV